jgi:hypothetical protein
VINTAPGQGGAAMKSVVAVLSKRTREFFAQFTADEIARWTKALRDAGISQDN